MGCWKYEPPFRRGPMKSRFRYYFERLLYRSHHLLLGIHLLFYFHHKHLLMSHSMPLFEKGRRL